MESSNALFTGDRDFAPIRAAMRRLSLAADPEFQDIYAGEMLFPG